MGKADTNRNINDKFIEMAKVWSRLKYLHLIGAANKNLYAAAPAQNNNTVQNICNKFTFYNN